MRDTRYGIRVTPISQAYRDGWERILWDTGRDSVDKPVPVDRGERGGRSERPVERFVPDAEYCARVLPGIYGWALD
jgi:hypothetical protein